mmetsp:Transcript_21187/g.47541  ORF Transcript_21187/g.47541 Transcript_21187/m.47541 type:complete len:262 (+) Transcript_21187:137-922(+)
MVLASSTCSCGGCNTFSAKRAQPSFSARRAAPQSSMPSPPCPLPYHHVRRPCPVLLQLPTTTLSAPSFSATIACTTLTSSAISSSAIASSALSATIPTTTLAAASVSSTTLATATVSSSISSTTVAAAPISTATITTAALSSSIPDLASAAPPLPRRRLAVTISASLATHLPHLRRHRCLCRVPRRLCLPRRAPLRSPASLTFAAPSRRSAHQVQSLGMLRLAHNRIAALPPSIGAVRSPTAVLKRLQNRKKVRVVSCSLL